MKLKIILFLSIFLIITFACSPDIKESRSGESYFSVTDDGAWCWFADPRAVYYEGQHKRTYIGWVNREGDILVAYYDHSNKEIKTSILKKDLQYDDHANPAILIRHDGHLIIFYSAHSGEKMFYRIAKNPEDIFSWGDEKELGTNTEGDRGYTYPNPFQLSNEDNMIYIFWRGGNSKPNYSRSRDGINWSPAKTLIKGSGVRPYVKYESNGIEKIHFAFTDGHPRREEKNNIYYACYHNGALYKADGTKIKDMNEVPIEPSEADKVYDASISGARAWIWDIAVDNSGNPVIVYTALPEETDHRYRYAKWNGSGWKDVEITSAGGGWFPQTQIGEREREPHYSGGIILDHVNPSIIYLSKKINGIFEIKKWITSDGGTTWISEKITSGSKKNNVRPFVSRGHKLNIAFLFWMYGDYIHYTKYFTEIKMK